MSSADAAPMTSTRHVPAAAERGGELCRGPVRDLAALVEDDHPASPSTPPRRGCGTKAARYDRRRGSGSAPAPHRAGSGPGRWSARRARGPRGQEGAPRPGLRAASARVRASPPVACVDLPRPRGRAPRRSAPAARGGPCGAGDRGSASSPPRAARDRAARTPAGSRWSAARPWSHAGRRAPPPPRRSARVAARYPREDPDRGRLPRAVRAEETHDLTAADLEAEVVDGGQRAVSARQVSHFDHGSQSLGRGGWEVNARSAGHSTFARRAGVLGASAFGGARVVAEPPVTNRVPRRIAPAVYGVRSGPLSRPLPHATTPLPPRSRRSRGHRRRPLRVRHRPRE